MSHKRPTISKEQQAANLRKSLQSDRFAQIVPHIKQGYAIRLSCCDGIPTTIDEMPEWSLTTEEAEAILREIHPDLSCTVHWIYMVIFYEKTTTN